LTENQLDVAHSLGRLEAGVEGIHSRLDKLNGSVARHEKRIGDIERWMWRSIGGLVVLVALLEWVTKR
jgi:hypothetical protein